MKFYTTLTIGAFHTNYCEDFLINVPIGTHQQLIAVLDGCTMGTESVFASILFGKILRKVAKKQFYNEFISKECNSDLAIKLKDTLKLLISEVRSLKSQLDLATHELLSTLIIGIIETEEAKAELLTIGDGLICIDGQLTEYEQNDRPDYLGYHISENFESWYESQQQKISISKFNDLSICTDGIFTFKDLDNKNHQRTEKEIIQHLLIDTEWQEFDNFLDRKVRALKKNWNHSVTDDLAIIRVKAD